jgi:hypothetical protein
VVVVVEEEGGGGGRGRLYWLLSRVCVLLPGIGRAKRYSLYLASRSGTQRVLISVGPWLLLRTFPPPGEEGGGVELLHIEFFRMTKKFVSEEWSVD